MGLRSCYQVVLFLFVVTLIDMVLCGIQALVPPTEQQWPIWASLIGTLVVGFGTMASMRVLRSFLFNGPEGGLAQAGELLIFCGGVFYLLFAMSPVPIMARWIGLGVGVIGFYALKNVIDILEWKLRNQIADILKHE